LLYPVFSDNIRCDGIWSNKESLFMQRRERFGDRLKRFRDSRGWSQRELAQRAGIPQPTIGYLETGRRSGLTVETARRIADALGISIDRLVGDSVFGDADAEEEESFAVRV
jgi:transcriptional regulator with XRE-family HTH domain